MCLFICMYKFIYQIGKLTYLYYEFLMALFDNESMLFKTLKSKLVLCLARHSGCELSQLNSHWARYKTIL